jgi:hypothetical protein
MIMIPVRFVSRLIHYGTILLGVARLSYGHSCYITSNSYTELWCKNSLLKQRVRGEHVETCL